MDKCGLTEIEIIDIIKDYVKSVTEFNREHNNKKAKNDKLNSFLQAVSTSDEVRFL